MINNEVVRVPFRFSGQNPELAILSQAIASSDDLVRKVESLVQENRKLKQKYRSLSQSAVQVKQLYEQERDVCLKVRTQNNDLKSKIATLTGRNSELEHSRINMQLTHSQAVAELELKNNQEASRSNNTLRELVFQCKDWTEGDSKFKGAVRQAIDLLEKRGVDVEKLSLTKPRHHRKNKQKRDDDTMSISSETCSTVFEESESLQVPDTTETFTEVKIKEKTFVTAETNTDTKTYCDKSTSYVTSTTTRGVSTESFIQKCDFTAMFPEPMTLRIEEIFKEMIVDVPQCLSPIPDSLPPVNRGTQTSPVTPEKDSNSTSPVKSRTVSTHTSLKNIRKPIGYVSSPNKSCMSIKKEEFDLNTPLDNDINPQLTQLWIILGKLLFGLIGNGQIFNNTTTFGHTWEQIQEISEMIEVRTLQEQEMRKAYLRQHVSEGLKNGTNDNAKDNQEDGMDADEQESETTGVESCNLEVPSIVSKISDDVGKETEDSVLLTASPIRPTPIEKLVQRMTSPVPSTSRCASPELPSFPIVPPLETTPRPIKRKLPQNDAPSPDEMRNRCNEILQSAKRRRDALELVSPIKDTPETHRLVTLSDLFGETDEEEEGEIVTVDPLIQSILDEESPASPPDWCKSGEGVPESQIIPLEPLLDLESPLSPQMTCNTEDDEDPVIIPLDRPCEETEKNGVRTPMGVSVPPNSVLHTIINEYDRKIRAEVVAKTLVKKKESPEMSHHIEVLRKSINQYLEGDWSREATQVICQKCMKFIQNVDVVISAILETIEDNADDPVNMENTPPAPPLPLTHQKLILVVEKLSGWLKQKLLVTLDRKIFSLKTGEENEKLETLMSLAHFYIGLTDIETPDQEISTARLFIYKALYYYNHKSFPLIYAMMLAQPHCLPKTSNTAYNDSDSLVTTLKSILMNSPKDRLERSEFKKRELRALLLTQYGYQPFKPSTDLLITDLIDRLKKHQLHNLEFSFILLAKRYGYEWAMSKIIKAHLYPLLEQLMTQSIETDIHDEKIVTCLRIISAILKTYPSNVDTTYFLQLFKTVLDRSQKPMIQEAAVEALLRFQRFGFVDIYQRIRKWNPEHKISPKLAMMMKTFVYRKDIKFWIGLSKTPS